VGTGHPRRFFGRALLAPPSHRTKKNHEKSVCGLANFCFASNIQIHQARTRELHKKKSVGLNLWAHAAVNGTKKPFFSDPLVFSSKNTTRRQKSVCGLANCKKNVRCTRNSLSHRSVKRTRGGNGASNNTNLLS
jgi:hypothetical protein